MIKGTRARGLVCKGGREVVCVQANKEFVVEHVFHARLHVCVRASGFWGCKREI